MFLRAFYKDFLSFLCWLDVMEDDMCTIVINARMSKIVRSEQERVEKRTSTSKGIFRTQPDLTLK